MLCFSLLAHSYTRPETLFDAVTKTVALASPIYAGTMAFSLIVYQYFLMKKTPEVQDNGGAAKTEASPAAGAPAAEPRAAATTDAA